MDACRLLFTCSSGHLLVHFDSLLVESQPLIFPSLLPDVCHCQAWMQLAIVPAPQPPKVEKDRTLYLVDATHAFCWMWPNFFEAVLNFSSLSFVIAVIACLPRCVTRPENFNSRCVLSCGSGELWVGSFPVMRICVAGSFGFANNQSMPLFDGKSFALKSPKKPRSHKQCK